MKRKIKIRVRGNRLLCWRLDEEGARRGEITDWKIGETSNVPRLLFFHIKNYVAQAVKKCNADDPIDLRRAVERGLREAGMVCSCEVKQARYGASVAWILKGTPLIGFLIHRGDVDRDRLKTLLRGLTIFRWTVALDKGRYVPFTIRRTRRAEEDD